MSEKYRNIAINDEEEEILIVDDDDDGIIVSKLRSSLVPYPDASDDDEHGDNVSAIRASDTSQR